LVMSASKGSAAIFFTALFYGAIAVIWTVQAAPRWFIERLFR
jgi:hypothetical protein